jgi:hypothetical protein
LENGFARKSNLTGERVAGQSEELGVDHIGLLAIRIMLGASIAAPGHATNERYYQMNISTYVAGQPKK